MKKTKRINWGWVTLGIVLLLLVGHIIGTEIAHTKNADKLRAGLRTYCQKEQEIINRTGEKPEEIYQNAKKELATFWASDKASQAEFEHFLNVLKADPKKMLVNKPDEKPDPQATGMIIWNLHLPKVAIVYGGTSFEATFAKEDGVYKLTSLKQQFAGNFSGRAPGRG